MNIQGYGDNLTVNDIRIGALSPSEHEKNEMNKGGKNYKPLKNVVVSHVQDSSTLICRKPSENGATPYVEEELIFTDEKVYDPSVSLRQKDRDTDEVYISYSTPKTQNRTYLYNIKTKEKK